MQYKQYLRKILEKYYKLNQIKIPVSPDLVQQCQLLHKLLSFFHLSRESDSVEKPIETKNECLRFLFIFFPNAIGSTCLVIQFTINTTPVITPVEALALHSLKLLHNSFQFMKSPVQETNTYIHQFVPGMFTE